MTAAVAEGRNQRFWIHIFNLHRAPRVIVSIHSRYVFYIIMQTIYVLLCTRKMDDVRLKTFDRRAAFKCEGL